MRTATLVLAALLAASCTEDARGLLVDLKTDYVAEAEFAGVRTSLFADLGEVGDAPLASREHTAVAGDDFIRGQRVAELSLVGTGSPVLLTELLRPDGSVVAERVSRIAFSAANTGVTVLVSRDCSGLVCPMPGGTAEATECYGGRCVAPDCVEENTAACGPPTCSADAECVSSVACAVGRCVAGACLSEPVDARCGADEYCDPTSGCQPRIVVDAGMDAMVDAGPDSAPGDVMPADAGPATYNLDGRDYTVPGHLVVELELPVAESSSFLDPSWTNSIASPPPGSAFPAGVYVAVGLGGTAPPAIFRISGGASSLFARASGEPAVNFTGAAFSPPASAYGDYLYLCSFEGGALDGLFRVDPGGTIERYSNHESCHGLDFDEAGLLGRGASLYASRSTDTIVRVTTTPTVQVLDTSLPLVNGENHLVVPQAGAFAGELLMVFDGNWDVTGDGFIGRSVGGMPWQPLTRFVTGIDPYGTTVATGPPFGDVWLVSAGNEIRGYSPDGSSTLLLSGMVNPGQLHLSPDESTLWVIDGTNGRILRVSAR